MNVLSRVLLGSGGPKRTYAFSTLEIDNHKDIAILSIVSSVFYVAVQEGYEESIYEDKRKIYYNGNDKNILLLKKSLVNFFKDFKKFESNLKKNDKANVEKFKELANKIYMKAILNKKFNNNFSLEIFAINILVSRFIDREGFKDIKRKPFNSLSGFCEISFLNIVSDIVTKHFKTDEFKREYLAARLVVRNISKL